MTRWSSGACLGRMLPPTVGFKVKLVSMDWNSLIDVYLSGANREPQFIIDAIDFSLSSIEPEQCIMQMTRYWPSNGLNWGYFSGAEADSLGDASLAEFEVTKRITLIGKMHQKLVGGA
jgi:peptide/nickel transport system substrate-binding protein